MNEVTVTLVIAQDEEVHPDIVRDDVAEVIVRAGFDLHSAWAATTGPEVREPQDPAAREPGDG